MYDILIRNGTVIDGTGAEMFLADVAVTDDRIVAIGDLGNESAHTVIDAEGHYVSPGFIDVTNHSDTYWQIFLTPSLQSLVQQGVTTIIGGNSGASLAPLVTKDAINVVQKWANMAKVNVNWLSMKEFLAQVDKQRLAVNFGTLVGHSTLRRGIIGDDYRELTQSEMRHMKRLLATALKQGALGLSTGLLYSHAAVAPRSEIEQLASVVRSYGGVYAVHLRDEAEDLIASVEEALSIGRSERVRIHISHLKAVGKENWHLMADALNLIDTARTSNVSVTFDVYPYTRTASVLYTFLPHWVAEGGKKMFLERLRNPTIRARVVQELKKSMINFSDALISISSLDKTITNRRIGDIARVSHRSIEDVVIDLLLACDDRVVVIMDLLSEKNISAAVRHPFSMVTSNGAGYTLSDASSHAYVHPRNFGAFPRILARYVRNSRMISWEEAIYKMTGAPARQFQIPKRGLLKKGWNADIVIFHPDVVTDRATFDHPFRYADGIVWVLVNGKVAIARGQYQDVRAGSILRRKRRFLQ